MNEVQVSRPEPGVALVRLAAPDRRNALTGAMARELTAALRELDADDSVGAVVISGGEEAFCAGAHRSVLAGAGQGGDRADLEAIYEIFATQRALAVPTVASVCGPAVGAGLNVALACDARLVGANAYLRSMFVANSIHPAGGHLRMLADLGGRSLAVRMASFDRPLDADAAVAAGLASGPYDPAAAEGEAVRFAALAGEAPRLARSIKGSVDLIGLLPMEEAAAREAQAQAESLVEDKPGEA